MTNLDAETLETQMQREKRLGPKAKVTNETFQDAEGDKKGIPKAYVRKSKLNIYLPQADPETLSAKSSCNSLCSYLIVYSSYFKLPVAAFYLQFHNSLYITRYPETTNVTENNQCR